MLLLTSNLVGLDIEVSVLGLAVPTVDFLLQALVGLESVFALHVVQLCLHIIAIFPRAIIHRLLVKVILRHTTFNYSSHEFIFGELIRFF
jgi:hypothetical protein